MGSLLKTHIAYIAGFLDGDGSLMLQIKKREDGKKKFRFMLTICFYQDTRHSKPLFWIRDKFKIGYISNRNDNMTELRINGFVQVNKILKLLLPFLKFKRNQAIAMIKASDILLKKPNNTLNRTDLKTLVRCIMTVQNNNYATRSKKTKDDLYDVLSITP